jgi:hypothetical protein
MAAQPCPNGCNSGQIIVKDTNGNIISSTTCLRCNGNGNIEVLLEDYPNQN